MRPVRLALRGRAREIVLGTDRARLDGHEVSFETSQGGGESIVLTIGGRRHRVASVRSGGRTFVWCDGAVYEFEDAQGARAAAGGDHHGGLSAPMPGRVRRLLTSEGAAVEKGQALLVLEAMKMEHAIRAPRDGSVRRLLVAEGDLVEAGAELIELADRA